MPFVTGDVPRLLQGASFDTYVSDLWLPDDVEASNVIGSLFFAMMGLPPSTEIGTSFRDGVPLKIHMCVTLGCNSWGQDKAVIWGRSVLAGKGGAIGPEVNLAKQTFTDYDT